MQMYIRCLYTLRQNTIRVVVFAPACVPANAFEAHLLGYGGTYHIYLAWLLFAHLRA